MIFFLLLLFVYFFPRAQLLKLAAHADFSEEAGRRRLVNLLKGHLVVSREKLGSACVIHACFRKGILGVRAF